MSNRQHPDVEAESFKQNVAAAAAYVNGLLDGQPGKPLYQRYREQLEQVTPHTIFAVFYQLYAQEIPAEKILTVLDKAINVFHQPLSRYEWTRPQPQTFPGLLRAENQALTGRLELIKAIIKSGPDQTQHLAAAVNELAAFKAHYQKKENILFPYMEKKMEHYHGLAIMWALHDQARSQIKKSINVISSRDSSLMQINQAIGRLFFVLYGLVQKEEWILFPIAQEVIQPSEWEEMLIQSREYEWAYIDGPQEIVNEQFSEPENKINSIEKSIMGESATEQIYMETETGRLSFDQIEQVFSALPVDLTVVDEDNRVCFFTRPAERIFPRSPAIIGRKVEHCHPPQSVGRVMAIIEAFREGRRDSAQFWIQLHGRFILIQYFALRGKLGQYRGTLEVSQDITDIRQLDGERRLLDWTPE